MIMEWNNNNNNNNNNNHEEEQHNHNQQEQVDQIVNNGVMYVKVMTDEQLETLRKQIAVYATICDQLVEMHKNLTAQQDLAAGGRLGNIYCDSFITSATPKITARQRWTPTPTQLQILERIFDQGNGTPTKQKIKDITSQLTQHGPISETNVYNWFQNRRARSKRKQVLLSSTNTNNNNNADSELDQTEVDSLCQNKVAKPENLLIAQGQGPGPPVAVAHAHAHAHDPCFHSPEITSSDMHFLGVLSNQKDDPLSRRMGITGSYNLYDESDEYGMA